MEQTNKARSFVKLQNNRSVQISDAYFYEIYLHFYGHASFQFNFWAVPQSI